MTTEQLLEQIEDVKNRGMVPFAFIVPIDPQLIADLKLSEEFLLKKFERECINVLKNIAVENANRTG